MRLHPAQQMHMAVVILKYEIQHLDELPRRIGEEKLSGKYEFQLRRVENVKNTVEK